MTQDEITVLAGHRIVSPWVMKLCMDVAKAEREACAKVCGTMWNEPNNGMSTEEQCYGDKCADAIRARGNP